ncbi:MAG: adenosylcobinamide-GDP ribazoletransferase, partial [Rhizobiaceae bacterium]
MHRITAANTPIDFSKSAYTFPLAGIIIALPGAAALYLALAVGLDSWIAAIAAVTVLLLVTGALHEDGLADVADGFWGSGTRERKLEIMCDSTIGTYGTLALICSIALRVSLLAALIRQIEPLPVVALFITVAGLSRLAVLQPWRVLPAARPTNSSDTDGKAISGLSARYGSPNMTSFI